MSTGGFSLISQTVCRKLEKTRFTTDQRQPDNGNLLAFLDRHNSGDNGLLFNDE